MVTGGIAGPQDLTAAQTPDWLMSCNNDGDLYGSAPVGTNPWTAPTGVGHDETMIFNLVQNASVGNMLALVQEALKTLGVVVTGGFNLANLVNVVGSVLEGVLGSAGIPGIPVTGATTPNHVVALVQAIYNGGMFVVRQAGPHMDYGKMVPAMTVWVIERAYAHA